MKKSVFILLAVLFVFSAFISGCKKAEPTNSETAAVVETSKFLMNRK